MNFSFNTSSMGWRTTSNIVGLFKIEAVITEKDHNPSYLSSAVMAGLFVAKVYSLVNRANFFGH
jgi:hypothetical protein